MSLERYFSRYSDFSLFLSVWGGKWRETEGFERVLGGQISTLCLFSLILSCFHDAPIAILCADYSSFPLPRDLGIHENLNDLEWGSSESCYYYYYFEMKKKRYFIEKTEKNYNL